MIGNYRKRAEITLREWDASLSSLLSQVEKERQRIVDFASSLVAIPSMNPPGDESALAEFVKEHFEKLGLRCDRLEARPKRVNLVFSENYSGKPRLVFNAHMDTVPITEESRWNFPPLSGIIKDGKLFGRGANDDKGGIATIFGALLALKNLGADLRGLEVHIVADEEAGSRCGTEYLLEHGYSRGEAAMVCEGSVFAGRAFIRSCFRGGSSLKLETHGHSSHVSMPKTGRNAVMAMASLLTELQKVKLTFRRHSYLPDPDATFGTTIRGGEVETIIPASCEATCFITTVPGMTQEGLLTDLQSVISELKAKDPEFDAQVKVISWSEPVDMTANSHLVSMIQELSDPVFGYSPLVRGGYGSNDAAVYNRAGIPAVAFGPADIELGRAHGVDEWQDIETMLSFSKVYASAAVRFCAPK